MKFLHCTCMCTCRYFDWIDSPSHRLSVRFIGHNLFSEIWHKNSLHCLDPLHFIRKYVTSFDEVRRMSQF